MPPFAADGPTPSRAAKKTATSTSSFGVGRRQSHDASEFYARFTPPVINDDDHINPPAVLDQMWVGDARDMDASGEIADSSVALVVTSPPYFAGKEYEQSVGDGGVPGSYIEYLQMLHDVFAECVRKLEPGGRVAVNVANLGRRPYRSLSADVTSILQDRLGLLLRGEIIWRKGRGANGSSAWGSFGQPSNPVLRDTTERIIVASKGRFDRARSRSQRTLDKAPSMPTIDADEYMEASLDIWDIAPESATRVGHPAPFPVALALRLIDVHSYAGDLILDPFIGSGTTAVAAVRSGRHYVGFDTDTSYITAARLRVAAESATEPETGHVSVRREVKAMLAAAGWQNIRERAAAPAGIEMPFVADDQQGQRWYFDLAGARSLSQQAGLGASELLWRTLGRAAVLRGCDPSIPVAALTVRTPAERTPAGRALAGATGTNALLRAVIDVTSPDAEAQLADLAAGQPAARSGVSHPLHNVTGRSDNSKEP